MIKNCINIKSLFVLFVLIFFPFVTFALISTPNPGGIFTDQDAHGIIKNIATFVVGIIAVLGIIFLIWGGILYVTSAGDENQIEKAKTTITYAILGLFVAGFAFSIEVIVFNLFNKI